MDIEKLLKTIYKQSRKDSKPQGACLTDQDIACFLDDRLSRKQRKLICAHVVSCATCADQFKDHLLIAEDVNSSPLLEVPQELEDMAKALVSSKVKPNILDIILNFTQDAIQLVKTTGDVLKTAVPIPVLRTNGKAEAMPNQIKIAKAFKNLALEVQVEKRRHDLADISVSISEEGKRKKPAGFRISLFRGEREICSKLADKGKIKFEEVKIGQYKIVISKEGIVSSIVYVTVNSKP
ncbi:MAG: hypothetical protein A3G33_07555 [Omnitrophica bacterium RIFCSPLOWO2_12_FULL_44_17]|uniref:Zinc-finger domain-containing protein n=1 Tax=Candidatus Danuiimicrobium aquiferis TaxID=1801832 RepID=A0A1G1KYR7_9BACT|nr:MAG: hypothetical protein A3B72_07855 [Omnitrophica bacterium RIFCSPHIGHO2_02_FULL_45_28]OGW92147.1 MAG: hypothetical protein A3E74_10285 [Omnitrophica bacterium RIFCSPHIGHO2_12_FULL_44_12]OGW98075.1 MAG: hypothetical protein A3G33_07555 [Omnitrophica bacterium RIFCSPLOWO2_12_FULL_44_17]OGX03483.1 MAG: hypothetical protein A3J12_02670 [Omnitrophica bacterium RIFCSPLOWO2_02_FULL_44_11]